jgi:predicted RNase H-like HicB family nuclease
VEKCKVTVILTQAAPGAPYVATFPAFPTWSTQGETVEEALRMAKELVELNLEEDEDEYRWLIEGAYSPLTVVGQIEVGIPKDPPNIENEPNRIPG